MRFVAIAISICIIFSGVGIMLSDISIGKMCRRDCSLNALFYLIGGDDGGKILLGGLVTVVGIWKCYAAIRRG